MNLHEQKQNFVAKAKVFYKHNYQTLTIQIPIIIGVISFLFAVVFMLGYVVELERLSWLYKNIRNTALINYIKEVSSYYLTFGVFLILLSIISFITAYIFDRRG